MPSNLRAAIQAGKQRPCYVHVRPVRHRRALCPKGQAFEADVLSSCQAKALHEASPKQQQCCLYCTVSCTRLLCPAYVFPRTSTKLFDVVSSALSHSHALWQGKLTCSEYQSKRPIHLALGVLIPACRMPVPLATKSILVTLTARKGSFGATAGDDVLSLI